MKHRTQARYPAPASVVIKMFTDQAFHTAKLEAMGLTRFKVLEHAFDGKSFRIRLERKIPLQLPGLGKSGAESTVINEEQWAVATRKGSVKVDVPGMPLACSCTTAMRDEGKGCVIDYDWEIKARIPLVGGALEKYVAGDMDKRTAEETAIGVKMVEKYR